MRAVLNDPEAVGQMKLTYVLPDYGSIPRGYVFDPDARRRSVSTSPRGVPGAGRGGAGGDGAGGMGRGEGSASVGSTPSAGANEGGDGAAAGTSGGGRGGSRDGDANAEDDDRDDGGGPPANAQMLQLSTERVSVPELLFRPSDAGIPQGGVAHAVHHAVRGLPKSLAPVGDALCVSGVSEGE